MHATSDYFALMFQSRGAVCDKTVPPRAKQISNDIHFAQILSSGCSSKFDPLNVSILVHHNGPQSQVMQPCNCACAHYWFMWPICSTAVRTCVVCLILVSGPVPRFIASVIKQKLKKNEYKGDVEENIGLYIV